MAVDAHVPPAELATELHEFRVEVQEGLAALDKNLRAMLTGRTEDREQLDSILRAVTAGVQRDEQLMAAVNEAAERDRQIIEDIRRISSALDKKSKRELAKRAKQTALEQFEITLESVEAESFDQGGQGAVHMARYANETVCLKKIQLAGTWSQRDKLCSAFAKELSIMVRLRSPRVVQVIGVVTTDNAYLGLVMEYWSVGRPPRPE